MFDQTDCIFFTINTLFHFACLDMPDNESACMATVTVSGGLN